MTNPIPESELILNKDGSIYHLNLRPEHLAETVITVGDPDRVPEVSKYFDTIEFKTQKRELVTHTGYLNNKRLTVLSTGMGTDNIDIVLNELDALVNIDLQERRIKENLTSLNIIRVGTAGCLQGDIPIDAFVLTTHAIGLDGLMPFYQLQQTAEENTLHEAFMKHMGDHLQGVNPYVVAASPNWLNNLKGDFIPGITATCAGFYGPQGRVLRAPIKSPEFIELLTTFKHETGLICNFEMETAGIYGMGRILDHHCCSVSVVVANRVRQEFSKDADGATDKLIQLVLENITTS